MHTQEGHRSTSRTPFDRHEPEVAIDLELGPEIEVNEPWQPLAGGPQVILLTGTTGFLGIYLLRDLLLHTQATIVCLVRAASVAAGRSRIEENFARYGLELTEAHARRVEPILGDLAESRLGLSEAVWDELTKRVDTVMHGAATVNFYQDYRRLRAVNVGGVREILRFSVAGRTKALHYISSIGVFDSEPYRGLRVTEADVPAHCRGNVMGYTQTKWVAEQLVLQARVRGLPASVYRPPFIMGDARTGAVDAENLVVKMLIGCIQGGYWPDQRTDVEMVSVDSLSRAIVYFAVDAAFHGRTFHLTSPARMQWADIGRAAQAHGYALELVPYDEWTQRLVDFARETHNALRPLIRFYTKVTSRANVPVPEIFARVPRPIFDSAVTQAALQEPGLVPVALGVPLFGRYLDYFVQQGWLGTPAEIKTERAAGASRRNDSRPPHAACAPHA